jgi:cytochrome c oxidase assembly protein subunit 11
MKMDSAKLGGRHRRTVGKLLLVAAGMFAFGFALVPIYRVICEVTGLNGYVSNRVASADAPTPEVDRDRLVTVEFVATVNGNAPWVFRPAVHRMQVHPGEIYTTTYYAENLTAAPLAGQASYSVAPGRAARWFGKPDCFCFTRQEFEAEEGRDMPVTFFVSPSLPADVDRVTLSYTFFALPDA